MDVRPFRLSIVALGLVAVAAVVAAWPRRAPPGPVGEPPAPPVEAIATVPEFVAPPPTTGPDVEWRTVDPDTLAALEQPATLGRAIPHRDANGEYDGYRIAAIRKDSVLERLGLANGDIVRTVDDVPMTSVERALDARKHLRAADRACVGIERRGSPLRLCYLRGS